MVPFAEADSARFFGREEEVTDLLQRLRLHPFLAVIGPSGSGKSSLVFAGLLPALRRSALFGLGDWRVCILRPGTSPLAALHTALGSDPAAPAQAVTAALAGQAEARRLLVVVDQLEELFTLGAQEATPFAQSLLALADTSGCFVLLTVRADFYPDLMTSPLWGRVQAHRAEVVPLSSEGLRQAIVRPAEDTGVFVETALVERLLADAANEPGVLPLVQETLVLLWEKLERRYLPLRAYEALVLPRAAFGADVVGSRTGLQVAMARRADAALADLSSAQQAIARRIFLRLVQFGEGRADTRRQQPLDDLRAAGDEAAAFDQTLAHLVNCRLLTLSGGDGGSARMVDIAHEALIGGWPALQEWIQARRAAELTRRRLEEKAADWARLGRGRGGLLDEVELAEAEAWLASPDAQELGYDAALAELAQASRAAIEAAVREQEAARQRELAQAQALAAEQQRVAEEQRRRAEEQAQAAARLRQRAVALAGVLLVACAAAVLALLQWRTASDETAQAQHARATAVVAAAKARSVAKAEATQVAISNAALSAQLTLQSANQLTAAPQVALLLAVEANRLASTAVARNSLQQALVYNLPIVTLLHGRTAMVNSVAFSPGGKTLASGGCGKVDGNGYCTLGEIQLWDMVTHKQLGALPGHAGVVNSVAFSPDGKTLASGGCGKVDGSEICTGEIQLWDVATHKQLGTPLTGNAAIVNSVAFSRDSKTLASGGCQLDSSGHCTLGEIQLWDVATHKQLGAPLTGNAAIVNSVAFSPDGKTLASSGCGPGAGSENCALGEITGGGIPVGEIQTPEIPGGEIQLWDVATHKQLGTPLTGNAAIMSSVAFSPDGKTLASDGCGQGCNGGLLQLWDFATHQPIGAPLTGSMNSVAFSPTGKTLASGGYAWTIQLWDVATHKQLGTFPGHAGIVYSVAFSPDGKTLASGGCASNVGCAQGVIRLWDVSVLHESITAWEQRACSIANRNLTPQEWARYIPGLPYPGTKKDQTSQKDQICPNVPAA
jgi:WD40 repeat protein